MRRSRMQIRAMQISRPLLMPSQRMGSRQKIKHQAYK
jgi:hypothetical protein